MNRTGIEHAWFSLPLEMDMSGKMVKMILSRLGKGQQEGGPKRGGPPPPLQSFEKPFSQNVEIHVERCLGGGGCYLVVKEDQIH